MRFASKKVRKLGPKPERLHLERGFSSLHEFAVKYLRYSDGAAHRRISAARLLRDLPQVQAQIESGALSLTVAAQAQNFFRAGKIANVHERLQIMESLEGKSAREAERELLKIAPNSIPKERERQVTETHIELKIVIDGALKSRLEHLRNLLSHRKAHMSYADLFEFATELALKELERLPLRASKAFSPKSRFPGKTLKSHVHRRDHGRCTFVDPLSGRKCESRFRLEFDHIRPFALGGRTELTNLRLLRRSHNQLLGVKTFGPSEALSGNSCAVS